MTVFDQLRQLEANATPGPWLPQGGFIYVGSDKPETLASYVGRDEDADFIVVARNLFGPLVAVAEAAEDTATRAWAIGDRGRAGITELKAALAALERAVTESAMSEGRCPGFPNCRCPNKQWASLDDPHGTFGAPGMMGG